MIRRTRSCWTDADDAQRDLMADYIPELQAAAGRLQRQHQRTACDQDFPVELLRCVPPAPHRAPLLIVGGMGPLAGAQALQAALERFGNEREIVLLQLCCVPDRTRALEQDRLLGRPSPLHREVVQSLQQGIVSAEAELETRALGPGHVVVACNTAHNFVPQAFEQVRLAGGNRLKLHSMVSCVMQSLADGHRPGDPPVVVLGTDGTLRTRLYTDPLQASGVDCLVPEPDAQHSLMAAIYQGVKAFDPAAVLQHGNALFRGLLRSGSVQPGRPLVVLAACTEVPEIVDTLRDHGDADIRSLLARATVADPMRITLDHIGRLDAGP